MSIDQFQNEFGRWADDTFPASTEQSIRQHFAREAIELVGIAEMEKALAHEKTKPLMFADASLSGDLHRTNMEIADCVLLLLHLCHKRGISMLDLANVKAGEIKHRKWGTPDSDGVVEHIRQSAQTREKPLENKS